MAIRYEHSGNAAATTLSTSISNVSTTINIASATGWPTGAVGPFWVTVDAGTAAEEKALCLSRTGTALTVSARGADGTTATSHASGAAIIHTFSATEADDANALAAQVTTSGGTVVTTSSIPATVVTTTGAQSVASKTFTGANFDVPTGHRNAIRNGDVSVAQRGRAAFTAVGYTVDGWRLDFSGGTASVTSPALTLGSGAKWGVQTVTAGQSVAGDYLRHELRIEDVTRFAGQTVTVGFDAFASAGTPKVGVEVTQNFGTTGSPSAAVNTAVSAVTTSTSKVRYTVSVAVPSVSGKTLGTDGNDYLSLNLWLSSGATNAARASSIGVQNSTITVTDVQVEAGSAATPFERLPQQVQLAWCQRYYWRRTATGGSVPLAGGGVAWTTGSYYFDIPNPVPMRAAPTVTGGGATSFAIATNGTSSNTTVGPASAGLHTVDNIEINFTCPAIGIAAGAAFLRSNQATYIDATAEL